MKSYTTFSTQKADSVPSPSEPSDEDLEIIRFSEALEIFSYTGRVPCLECNGTSLAISRTRTRVLLLFSLLN